MHKQSNPNAKTKYHLNIDRETELYVIDKAKRNEKKRELVPVKVNAKTVIFIDKNRDKQQAVEEFKRKLEMADKPVNKSPAIKEKPTKQKPEKVYKRGPYNKKRR